MACDESYAMPLATTLRSVSDSTGGTLPWDVIILTSGFSDALKQKVRASIGFGTSQVLWLPADLSRFEGFETMPYLSKMTYARLLIPRVVGEEVDRVLYLDADTLVLKDLEPLWNADLGNAVVGAVRDIDSTVHRQRLGLPGGDEAGYFNAGVLLVNLARWRAERISEKAIEFLQEHPDSPLSDQDALNVACAGLWRELDGRWNRMLHPSQGYGAMEVVDLPSIIHFGGRHKPWDALSFNAQFYDVYRRQTEFRRSQFEVWRDDCCVSWMRMKQLVKRSRVLTRAYAGLRSLAGPTSKSGSFGSSVPK